MTILKYKDFQGSVTFEDGQLIIQALHIDDFLTTECDKASEAQAAFENLIDDYLETCDLLGKEPAKPFKGSFNVRITPNLHRRAAMSASAQHETLNSWVTGAIERRLEQDTRRDAFVDLDVIKRYLTKMRQATKVEDLGWLNAEPSPDRQRTRNAERYYETHSFQYLTERRSNQYYHKGNA